jgi:hypothetical protein
MSDAIWLEVFDGTDKTGGDRDNVMILRLGDELAEAATELGVPKLSTFYDSSALADAYAGEFEDAEPLSVEPAWFDAAAGLQAVAALLEALRGGRLQARLKLDATRSHWSEMLLEELEYCHGALSHAAERGQRFHFLVVP